MTGGAIALLAVRRAPPRRHVARSTAEPGTVVRTLAEARALGGAYAVFEGDFGGRLYAVMPVGRIRCGEETLQALLAVLDRAGHDDARSRGLFYEVRAPGERIAGGMGGAIAGEELWLNEQLRAAPVRRTVAAILAGRDPAGGLARLQRLLG